MIIVYIIITVWLSAWLLPKLLRWLLKRGTQKMQRRIFERMGIDPSVFGQAMRQESQDAAHSYGDYGNTQHHRRRARRRFTGRIIPPEYAETVSFAEQAITGNEVWLDTAGSPVFTEYRCETQISDAKWTLIK